MFARDFWRSSRWHTLVPGDPGSEFYFTQGLSILSLSTSSATVEFATNVPSMAYMEWAYSEAELGTAAGFTNEPGETSFSYSTHVQQASPLNPATTYFLRVIVEDANGTTLTSSVVTFTSEGDQPPPNPHEDVGPRYDLYGSGSGGDYPVLGTEPSGGGSVSWGAGNVYIVPDSVYTASNVAAELATWIMNDVPDGASAASPSYIVFDRSHDGVDSTQYGNGTSYTLTARIQLNIYSALSKRSNLCFWGYNARLDFVSTTGNAGPTALLDFQGGGWENVYVLGFEFYGPGRDRTVPTWQTDGDNGAAEKDRGVSVNSFSGFKMMDCYMHQGSGLFANREWALGADDGNHYDGWSHGPYANDLEVAYNHLYFSMNQGIIIEMGHNIDVHHNHVHDIRQKPFSGEEINGNPVGSLARRIVNLTIRDNRFGNWSWQAPSVSAGNLRTSCICPAHADVDGLPRLDFYDNLQLLRNEVYGGPMAALNPSVQEEVLGYCDVCSADGVASRDALAFQTLGPWQAPYPRPYITSLTVKGNVSLLPQWCVDGNDVGWDWGLSADIRDFVVVEDNDFQGMSWRFYNTPDSIITWQRNGSSTYHLY